MNDFSRSLQDLSAEDRRELLARLLQQQADQPETCLLSFAQQRLWFLDQLIPGTPLYNISRPFLVTGPPNREALEQSLNEIIRRHEVLRTSFVMKEETPVQVIAPQLQLKLAMETPEELSGSDREAHIARLAQEEARRPFDLRKAPLLRVRLFFLGREEHLLIITMHHSISDGWSMSLFFQELGALYGAFSRGLPSPLPELPIQYADFSAWQREHLQGEALEKLVTYWKNQLHGSPALLDLPTDHPQPAVATFRGALHPFQVPGHIVESLRTLGQQEGATLFMVLLAAFQLLLARYSGQEDILVGSPVAGRTRGEVELLIGFFSNTLVLRAQISGQKNFRRLLKEVRETTIEAFAHQELPFEKLVEELDPVRSLSHMPIFQVMFTFQNTPPERPELPGLILKPLDTHENETAKFSLSLTLTETAGGLDGYFEYCTDLFEAATIQRMTDHYVRLLEQLAASPDRQLLDYVFLSEAEQQLLLHEWNTTAKQFPEEALLVHQLFERQAALTPEAPALSYENHRLTYRELNARANQVARYLRSLGVGPEVPVGLYMERSLEAIVGLLGILKAGGAYVPLDPDYPPARIALLLKDFQGKFLLTQKHLLVRLPEVEARAISLDREWESISRESEENLVNVATGDNLAYIIYTSGSTGQPKGVLVEHRQIGHYLRTILDRLHFAPQSSFAMLQPLTFDLCLTMLFPALCTGGWLHYVSRERAMDAPALAAYFQTHTIDYLKITPSHLAALQAAIEPAQLMPRRMLILGGEASRRDWIQTLRSLAPGCALVNHYGPTEATVGALTYRVGEEAGQQPSLTVPAGHPLANVQAYVLNAHLQTQPVGVAGELYLGGAGVARGYLSQAGLTAERFIPDPFSSTPGARLYRTGDLVRYLPDGNIDYLGRTDRQTKLRGFRIEPGEIEALLIQHCDVRDAVVLVREDRPGEKRLVAYFVAQPGRQIAPGDLRAYLKERVPDYMIPAVFMLLDELPLTAHGKIDHLALPAPGEAGSDESDTFTGPETPIEEILATIWSRVLGLEQIGRHTNFFDTGGHSLLATQIISRAREACAVEIPLRVLFEAPTIAELAARIEELQRTAQALATPPLRPVSHARPLPPSFAQQRLWFLDQWEPGSSLYNTSAVFRLVGQLDLRVLGKSLNELVRRHEILRTTFAASEGQPIQLITPALALPLVVEDLTIYPEDQRAALAFQRANEEERRPFDLQRGPLLRAVVFALAEDEHLFLLTLHHIIMDGWSMGILVQELGELYQAFAEGRSSPLPPLPIQYKDFAAWQRECLQGDVLASHIAYWQQQLSGIPTVLELPTDRARPPRQTFRGAWYTFALPDELVNALKKLSRREEVTLFMTLLAAFEILLWRYTGQEDFVLGTPVAGRDRPELEGLIGLFINTLVLRADLSGSPTFLALLKRAREITLEAYAHQDLPFERLVERLRPERDPSRNPLVQVLFRVHNTPKALLRLPGIETTIVETEDTTSKFDLSLVFLETPGEDWSGCFEYSTDLFHADTIARMTEQLLTLLENIAARPQAHIADLLPLDAMKGLRRTARQVTIGGTSILLNEVERAVLNRTAIHSCRVVARENLDGEQELAAYVVTTGPASPERWQEHLRAALPEAWIPRAYLPVSHIPLTNAGEVDDDALLAMTPVTVHALARWEDYLRRQEDVERVAVMMQEPSAPRQLLHLVDLLPDWTDSSRESAHGPAVEERQGQVEESVPTAPVRPPAWSDGGPLSIPASAPKTLTEALLQTARIHKDKGQLVVQADGSQVFQSYPELLEKAGRVMNGLYENGLRPGDRAILQVEALHDHFVAFWGCVLGGIRPVTVAIAPTYAMPNAVTNKLRNIWELLEHPVVLTSTSLVQALAGLETLHGMEGLHILSVDELKTYPPAERFHQSQPEDVIFYQLTSGSTGIPKCIQETHRAIIAHIHGSAQFNGYTADDVTLNWLPMDHVVPILTFHLKDVYLGCQQLHVKTEYILSQPLRWLDLMEAERVTHSWSPNFGFKLVSDRLATSPDRTWDLSSLIFLMNAGEQVTLPVVRDFLERTAAFGVRPQVIQPAFGMAEVCTCMTYHNDFTPNTGAHRVLKSSLGGALQLATEEADERTVVTFVDLGGPMPGVQIRITDAENRVVPEGTIGQFQIKGDVLMPGYLYNDAANRESFVGDGWFNSGDLGFILNGRLTLTGRAKEMIIIRGANFYCYEIEDVVNAIDGVEPTFVGTCAVEDTTTGSEGLAIFFVPRANATEKLAELIRTIHRNVATQLGIAPRFIVPLTREQFPKTTSGKIQRSQLKKSLAVGEYQTQLKQVDLLLENENTLPDWFYRKRWQRRNIDQQRPRTNEGAVLVLLDNEGVGATLCKLLRNEQQRCITVESGVGFAQLGRDRYCIEPGREADYRSLSAALLVERVAIKHVIHLWGYQTQRAEDEQGAHFQAEQSRGVLSLLFLVQALEQQWLRGEGERSTLLVVSNQVQTVTEDEEVAYEKAPVLGLLKTIGQELPWLHCMHLDIAGDDAEQQARHIFSDLAGNQEDQEVAYREGQRFVARLERIDWSREAWQALPLVEQGCYLLSGGLGGVGYELARHLLQEYRARLLLIGRTPIFPDQEASSPETPAARLAALQELARKGGAVRYEQVDVCDLTGLQRVVREAQQWWGAELDGIFHLAGAFHERALLSESAQQFEQALAAKVEGTWNLHQLLKERPGALFVSFSSVNAFFGGGNVGAYAAANSFLESFAHYQRTQCKLHSYCIAWSMWDETGISRGYQLKGFSQTRGYQAIAPQRGWYSLLTILHHAPASLLVGLDGGNQHIRRHLAGPAHALQEAVAYLSPESWPEAQRDWPAKWGMLPVNYRIASLAAMPLKETGEIDVERLAGTDQATGQTAQQEPRSKLEQEILEVWRQILNNPEIGVQDNFFELGGHSLVATQLVARLQRVLQVEVSVRSLFETPTVARLAEAIMQKEIESADDELLDQLLADLEQ